MVMILILATKYYTRMPPKNWTAFHEFASFEHVGYIDDMVHELIDECAHF